MSDILIQPEQAIEEMFKDFEKSGIEVQMDALAEDARNLDSYSKEAANGISARDALQSGLGGGSSQSAAYERGR